MHTATPTFAMVLDTIVKSTVLLALAWAAALFLRRRSAATQHLVRTFALAALLLLPCSVILLPAWHVKGIPGFSASQAAAPRPAHAQQSTTVLSSVNSQQAPLSTTVQVVPFAPSSTLAAKSKATIAPPPKVTRSTSTAVKVALLPSDSASVAATGPARSTNHPPVSDTSPTTSLTAYVPLLLLGLWIAGALFFLARWRLNALRLTGLVRRAPVLTDSGWNSQVRALAGNLGIERHVALLVSDEIEVPITSGILFPRIILSPDYSEWSPARRSAILNHELAHIKRLDALTQALGHLVAALYWFHPLVWLMVRAMRAERERACDDHVLASGTKASDYAHELLDIVSGLREPELAVALAMARRSQLEGRVLAVLNPALPRGSVTPRAALAIAALTLGIVLPLSALRPAQQAAPPTKASKKKPSPASTPAAASPRSSVSSAAPVTASTPAPVSDEPAEVAEAPEAPEPPEPGEPAEAPEAPAPPEPPYQSGVPAVPAVPAAPAAPAVPGVPAVPAVPAVPSVPGGDLSLCGTRAQLHHMNIESHNGDKHWTATWSADNCSLDLRAEGEVKFNPEATEIQSISPGGYFEVNLRQDDTLKQVKVTPGTGGLQYVYKINGKQQPFEGDAKTWFAQFLLALERTTGIAADTRVPALLAKGGPTAVLDEISNLQSDYVRGIYFRKLLEQPNLPSSVVQRVIKQAGEQIHSDYELARVLMTVGKQYDLPDEASRTAFLTAAGKLKSDYEHSRVLIELLRRPNISKENVAMALNSASTIKSDYEKSRILLSLMDQKSFDQSQLDFYLKLVGSIQSDYEKSRDLLAPLQKYTLAADQVNRIMDATSGMGSDYEKSRLLLGLAKQGKFDEAQMTNYLKVVDSMKSDYERSRCLLALMETNKLSNASLAKVLEAVGRIKSDYEKSQVLQTVARSYTLEGQLRESYIKAAESIHSEYERNRALAGVVKRATL
jgi:beta-lactamase regulating signal transducer with metallopeptidase domain